MEECVRSLERLLDKVMRGITEANRHRELITKFSELMAPEVAYQLSLQAFATFEECLMRAQELDLLQSRLRHSRVGTPATGRTLIATSERKTMFWLRRNRTRAARVPQSKRP